MSDKNGSSMMVAFQEDALEIMNEWEQTCLKTSLLSSEELFGSLMRCTHNLKGNAGLMGFNQLKDVVHRLEERLQILSGQKANPTDQSMQLILFDIEKLLRNWIGELASDESFQQKDLHVFTKLEQWSPGEAAELTAVSDVSTISDQVIGGSDIMRIPSSKLDALIQQVGELTLAQAIVNRGKTENRLNSKAVNDAISICEKLVRDLRTSVLALRMLPMTSLYLKLERASRELSIHLNKPLNLVVNGRDVSIDKAVLNKIFDPLLHLLRNAIDHGLESPVERAASGKSKTGTITVSASILPNGVCITMSDDGRGMDADKIKAKAIQKGLISAQQNLTENETLNLIFAPGFSTADKVTDISGRGVGLDVVKRGVINLGGQVDLRTKKNQGTEFIINLPANISLIDVFVVKNGGHCYSVPTQDVVEILNSQDVVIQSSVQHKKMILLRNRVVPIESLDVFLKQRENAVREEETHRILIVNNVDDFFGLWVDEVIDQQQVFVRPVKGYISQLPYITGSTVLSDGEPSLVVNLKEMANDHFQNKKRGALVGEYTI